MATCMEKDLDTRKPISPEIKPLILSGGSPTVDTRVISDSRNDNRNERASLQKEKTERDKRKSPRPKPNKKPKEKTSLESMDKRDFVKDLYYKDYASREDGLREFGIYGVKELGLEKKDKSKKLELMKSKEGGNNELGEKEKKDKGKEGSDNERKKEKEVIEVGEKKLKEEKKDEKLEKKESDNEKKTNDVDRKFEKLGGDKNKERDIEISLNSSPITTHHFDEDDFGRLGSPLRRIEHKPRLLTLIDDSESLSEEERVSRQQQRAERRWKLIQELVRSEETHVEALKTVIVNYLSPLKEKKILSLPVIKRLFGNIELILTWNMDFLVRLKERLELTDCFGDLVVKMSVILRQLFTQYNENYQQAQLTYTECLKNNKEFEQFIQKNNQASPNSNLLTSLYLPIQRMIMYDSLLKDIVVLTPPNHQDYEYLCTAYKLLRSMDKAANRVVEKRKNLETVMKIQNSLTGDVCIALPHRRHVFEEDVMLVIGKSHKKQTLYLFNDILLVAKLRKKINTT